MGDRTLRNVAGLALAAAAVVLLAACGSSSGGPGVAQLGSGGSGGPSASAKPDALAYAQCMRGHGVGGFPDPDSSGQYPAGSLKGIDRNSAQFRSAQQACRSLRPPGIAQTVLQDQPQLLKFSACMRSHGEPKFPDIGAQSTRRAIVDSIKSLDPSSPQFQSALSACRHLLPANLADLGGK